MFFGCGMVCGLPKRFRGMAEFDPEPSQGPRIGGVQQAPHGISKFHHVGHGLHPVFRSDSNQPEYLSREKIFEPVTLKLDKMAGKEVSKDMKSKLKII